MYAKSMKLLLGIAICAVLAFPYLCSASTAKGKPWTFAVNTPEAFAEQAATVREEMEPDGCYSRISEDDRELVEAELVKIEDLLQLRGSADKLDDSRQVELANAQEQINALLTENDSDQLICTLDRRTGSRFRIKVCMTAAERKERIRSTQSALQNFKGNHQPSMTGS